MDDDHAPSGLLIAALGAAMLAISVFQPWYGLSITPSGAAVAQHQLAAMAQQYGNPALQSQAHAIETKFTSLAGHEITTVSAHQALKKDSLILLALAGIALLASLLRLAGMRGLLFTTGSHIAVLGGLAFADVFFRILWRPGAGGEHFVAFSLHWGIFLALLSAAAIAGGGLLAGSNRTSHRHGRRVGPGPPPIARDVTRFARPLAAFRRLSDAGLAAVLPAGLPCSSGASTRSASRRPLRPSSATG